MRYLANLLTAGDEAPVQHALERLLAMRAYMRAESVHGEQDEAILADVGLDRATVRDMYRIMAIANYEDRFVVPSSHKEMVEDSFNDKGSCGFTFGNGCSGGVSAGALFGQNPSGSALFIEIPKSRQQATLRSAACRLRTHG